MRIHVLTDGTVELDIQDGEQAAALDFIRRLRANPGSESSELQPDDLREATAALTASQHETWAYLAQHPRGLHVSAVARHFGLSPGASTHRLRCLVKAGVAERMARGYYRAFPQ